MIKLTATIPTPKQVKLTKITELIRNNSSKLGGKYFINFGPILFVIALGNFFQKLANNWDKLNNWG